MLVPAPVPLYPPADLAPYGGGWGCRLTPANGAPLQHVAGPQGRGVRAQHFPVVLDTSQRRGYMAPGQPLRTAPNRHQPPTANRHQLPTANRQPLFNTVSVDLCFAHVLTMKQRASP